MKNGKELLERALQWMKRNRRLLFCTGAAAAALAILAGMSLCALRQLALPADREEAMQESLPAAEPKKTKTDQKTSPEPGKTNGDQKTSPEPGKTNGDQKTSPEPGKTNGDQKISPEPGKTNTDRKISPDPEKKKEPRIPKSMPEAGTAEKTEGPAAEAPAASSAEQHPVETENVIKENDVQEEHDHEWIPVTVSVHHDAVTHVVHHDAETKIVHHDAVSHEEPVYELRTICDTCGEDITGHIPDHIGTVCQGSYSVQQVETGVNVITDKEAWDEEVVVKDAWDETVTDREAYEEEITTGYRCRICGQFRQE